MTEVEDCRTITVERGETQEEKLVKMMPFILECIGKVDVYDTNGFKIIDIENGKVKHKCAYDIISTYASTEQYEKFLEYLNI
jgi:hypothetical protein